jgi:hypothetical protein
MLHPLVKGDAAEVARADFALGAVMTDTAGRVVPRLGRAPGKDVLCPLVSLHPSLTG